MSTDVRKARRAFLWVGVIVPLGIIALASVVIAAWIPDIPDPAAIHWSGSGPDGFEPAWTYIVICAGLGGGMIVLFALLAWFAHRVPSALQRGPVVSESAEKLQWSPTARFLGAVNLGLAAMLSYIALVGVGIQRGLADAKDAPDIGPWMPAAFALLVGLSIAGWFLQPKTPQPEARVGAPVEQIPLAVGEKAAWLGTATMSRGGVTVLVAAVVFLVVRTVMLISEGDSGWWIFGVTSVVIALLSASTLTFRVRVNARGLAARSLLGWPRTHIPLSDIDKVETVQINPFAEFGGWGWRRGLDGRRGIVLRAGEALQVTRNDERVFVVTVAEAREAAAVLETLRSADSSLKIRKELP